MKRLASLFYLLIFILLLVGCTNNTGTNQSSIDPSNTNTQASTLPATTATGTFREYPLPQSQSGLMRPAIDSKGRIWFGEMGHNYLAVFDPRTQTFQQMNPPRGRSGIMGIQVAPDDTVWFAEQYANYIGHYFPTTGQYIIYPLPTLTVPDPGNSGKTLTLPSGPNDLALDGHGNVWFTEMNADSLARLNISSGYIQQYQISPKKSVQTLNPYGVTIDHMGKVWFTESSNNHVGQLNPTTGTIRFFTMQGPNVPLMEIASDTHGSLWITSFTSGLLLNLDPGTGQFTPYYAPFSSNGVGGIYGLLVTPTGQVWTAISAENVIARLDVASKHFTYYPIPTKGTLPIGLVMDANHTLWFTEAGVDKIGMLKS